MPLQFRYPLTTLLLLQSIGFVFLRQFDEISLWILGLCCLFHLCLFVGLFLSRQVSDQTKAIGLMYLIAIYQALSGSIQEKAWEDDWNHQAIEKSGRFDVILKNLFKKKDHWLLTFEDQSNQEILIAKVDHLPSNIAIFSRYWLVGECRKFPKPLQSTDWDEMAYAQRNRFSWKAKVKGIYLQETSYFHDVYRSYLSFFLKARSYFEEKGEAGALINGLIFGDLSISQESRQAFNATGISHLLSVSGFHVSLLAYLLLLFFDAVFVLCGCLLPRKWSILVTLICIWIFIAMAQFSTCAQRSGYMTSLMLIFSHSKIRLAAIETCSISALILFDPMSQLGDISLQLSYAAVYALLLFSSLDALKRLSTWLQMILSTLLVSVVAMGATIGLQAYHFGTCSPFSVIFNCILTPIGGVVLMPMAIIALLIAPISTFAIDWVCICTDIWRNWTLFCADLIGGELFVARSNAWLFGLCSLCFFVGLSWMKGYFKSIQSKKQKAVGVVILMSLCLCCLFFWQKEKANQIEKLSISWLSIGQGNATVIAGETGFAMVDLGPKANQFQLISALKLNGIQKLDWILISHLHPDHYGGLWGLLDENIEIGEIQYHGHMLGGGEWGALVDRMKTKGIPLKMIQKGRFQWDGLIFEDLWDLSTLGFDLDLALENDLSIARMLILEGKGTILLSGDLEEQGEARLIVALLDFEKRYPHLPILAFQVNHHGSRTSSHPMLIALFEKHQAKAVISLGLNHKFGFPHPQTVYRLRALSSFRTDLGRIDFRFSTLKSP